ncbi:CBS domain-containing protein [Allokutzneria oryzae]|uniref:CBS domain-containing protein n=1 Tax=Allokutzneria oryzae TaxID=1378989 RepID=A0ABV6A392_9PSEU
MREPTVRSVMSTDVVTVTPRTPFTHAAALMIRHGVSALAVVNEAGVLIGVVSDTDLRLRESHREEGGSVLDRWLQRHSRRRAAARTAGGAMTPRPATIDAGLGLSTAAALLNRSGLRRVFVVDDAGRPIGVLALRDPVRPLPRTDAELAEELREVLQRPPLAGAHSPRVRVRDGVATLFGRVHRRSDAQLAVALTAAMPGVVDVRDELEYVLDDLAGSPR